MREETNNEIDLLLQRLSRRRGVPSSDAEFRIDTDHLDADELSSYAENTLPSATRARYTEHLAECSRCRELVVQLSASVSVVVAKETVTAVEASGLRKFLASLLSPIVLRYAVPAMVLIVAAAIGFVVLRSKPPGTSVAELEPYRDIKPAAVPTQEPTPTSLLNGQAKIDPRSQSATPEINAAVSKQSQVAPPPPNAPPAVSVRVEPKTEAPAQKAEDQATANAAPAKPAATSAPALKPTETVDEIRVEVEGRKPPAPDSAAPASAAARERNDGAARSENKKKGDLATASKSKTDSRAQGGRTFGVGQSAESDQAAATRVVAGRRFRKQGGVWVDAAYDSGATVNVTRGSEQYRALVADEPAIKTIADQLDGAIIVVWKGRTYRIR